MKKLLFLFLVCFSSQTFAEPETKPHEIQDTTQVKSQVKSEDESDQEKPVRRQIKFPPLEATPQTSADQFQQQFNGDLDAQRVRTNTMILNRKFKR